MHFVVETWRRRRRQLSCVGPRVAHTLGRVALPRWDHGTCGHLFCLLPCALPVTCIGHPRMAPFAVQALRVSVGKLAQHQHPHHCRNRVRCLVRDRYANARLLGTSVSLGGRFALVTRGAHTRHAYRCILLLLADRALQLGSCTTCTCRAMLTVRSSALCRWARRSVNLLAKQRAPKASALHHPVPRGYARR